MRADGKRVKNLPPLVAAIPYIMPHRYDAQIMVTEYVDEDLIKGFIREKRREGHTVDHMAVIIAAYYKAVLKNPKMNYFVVNQKLYERNHFCVSFVLLKRLPDGRPDETTLKVFLEPSDNVFTITDKIRRLVAENEKTEQKNGTDRFARFLFAVPGLARIVVGLVRLLDRWGLLPRKVIDISPFHTSLFITNLASIKTSHIYHHCYELGTTSIFISMGKPLPGFVKGDMEKTMMPLGMVLDERICTGYEYATFCTDFRKNLRQPEILVTSFEEA